MRVPTQSDQVSGRNREYGIGSSYLVRAMMYSQFSYFTPDNISIGPLEIRTLLFQERQIRSHFSTGLFIQPIEKIIKR
jgi:hypothetical protein